MVGEVGEGGRAGAERVVRVVGGDAADEEHDRLRLHGIRGEAAPKV